MNQLLRSWPLTQMSWLTGFNISRGSQSSHPFPSGCPLTINLFSELEACEIELLKGDAA